MLRRQLFSLFALMGISAVAKPKNICPVCEEKIEKDEYCALRNGAEVHFRHAIKDHFKPLAKK